MANHPYPTQSQLEALARSITDNPNWEEQARCRKPDVDPELFHPTRNAHGVRARAKEVCAACSVRSQCLQWALENGEPESIYGGLDGFERREMFRNTHQLAS